MKSFYTFCHLSGPSGCPLATSTSTVEDIEKRVQGIIQSLYHHPIALDSPFGPEVFTYTDMRGIIFSALYSPTLAFGAVAGILAAVENGGGDYLEQIAMVLHDNNVYTCGEDRMADLRTEVPTQAILCGESVDQTALSQHGFEEYWHLLSGISPAAGSIWAMLKMKCAAWPIRAVYGLGGSDDNFGGNTSHPILFISNTADPVTPLKSGRHMSERFPGSALLIQDSAGHCSNAAPTPCTLKAIREYFQTGALPHKDTVCIPPSSPNSLNSTDPDSPFYDPSLGQGTFLTAENMGEEMEAAKELQALKAKFPYFGKDILGQRVQDMLLSAVEFHADSTIREKEL